MVVLSPTAKDQHRTAPGLMAIERQHVCSWSKRLGTNSLLDIVVFGRAAAHRAVDTMKPGESLPPLPESATQKAIDRFDRIRHSKGVSTAELRLDMQKAMQKHAAVFRTEILDEGVKKLGDIAMDMNNVRIQDKSLIWNTELIETLELDNLMGQAL